jgi:hypothetical protein
VSRLSFTIRSNLVALRGAGRGARTPVLNAIEAIKCFLHNEGARRELCAPYCQPSKLTEVPEPTLQDLFDLIDELCSWVVRGILSRGVVFDVLPLREFRSAEIPRPSTGRAAIPSSGFSLTNEPFGRKLTNAEWKGYAGRADVALNLLKDLVSKLADPGEDDDELDGLEPQQRRLFEYMRDRDSAHLRDVCPAVWGRDHNDVKLANVDTALSKLNTFLATRGYMRTLSRKESTLRWV